MPSAKKRRVTVRRAEAGASDPIQKARQAGIREGRELARVEHKKAERAMIARVKADERTIRDEVMARMEKEIEDLQERLRVMERQKAGPNSKPQRRRDSADKWDKQHETKEWIAPFDEDDTQIRRRGGPLDP